MIQQARLSNTGYQLIEKCSPEEYVEIQSYCDCFIGTRMHSLIMCAVAGTPFLGLNYNPKVRDFMKSLNLHQYCLDYSVHGVSLLDEKFTELLGNTHEVKEQIIDEREELKTQIKEIMEKDFLAHSA